MKYKTGYRDKSGQEMVVKGRGKNEVAIATTMWDYEWTMSATSEQLNYAKRIALCLNYCDGLTDEKLKLGRKK